MGMVNAASATASLHSSYRGLGLVLLCGIYGSAPSLDGTNEVLIGFVSNCVFQYYLGRRYPGQFAPKDIIGDSLESPTMETWSLLMEFETQRK
ncbi:hypothetical protein LZ32DRAFT_598491 [Colletotrichum eremochloae]|nr:hypothetical protein LZ32DRAFT_598491 [Colletotrichum eremochloae]